MVVSRVLGKVFFWKTIQFLLSIVIFIILANLLEASISAEFQTLVYLLSLLSSFFILGLDVGISYSFSKREIPLSNINALIVVISLFALLFSLPVIYFFYHKIIVGFGPKEIICFAGLYILGSITSILSGSVFTVYAQGHTVTKLSVYCALFFLCSVLAVNKFFSHEVLIGYIFYAWFAIVFIQGCLIFFYSRQFDKKHFVFDFSGLIHVRKIIKFSFFVFLINMVFLLAARLPVFLLPYWTDKKSVGNYIYAYRIIEYAAAIVAFAYFPVITIVADKQNENTDEKILLLTRMSNTFSLVVSAVLLLSGWFIFPLVFGDTFNDMYVIFICLAPALIASCGSTFFTAYFFGKNYLKYNFISACILFFFLFITAGPLISLWGVKGAGIAISLSNMASFFFDMYAFRKFYDFKYTSVLIINQKDYQKLMHFIRFRK